MLEAGFVPMGSSHAGSRILGNLVLKKPIKNIQNRGIKLIEHGLILILFTSYIRCSSNELIPLLLFVMVCYSNVIIHNFIFVLLLCCKLL